MFRDLLLVLLFVATGAIADAASPKELIQLQQQYAFLVAERVSSPYDKGMEGLSAKFLIALTSAEEEAKKAGRLPEVIAIEEEKKLIANNESPPEGDDEATPAPLKKLRAVYRSEVGKLSQQRSAAQAGLLAAYTINLQALESTLTKTDRVEEAKEVMQYRKGLETTVTNARIGKAFTNSLGMKFVKVSGTQVLFCIHETRRQDYAAYAKEVPNVNAEWSAQQKDGVPIGNQDDHPVVAVNWADAKEFCRWLGKKEGRVYRLPTDKEWSYAVGIGDMEVWAGDTTPEFRRTYQKEHFPWEGDYPPVRNNQDGNYADMVWKERFPTRGFIEGYSDGFITTSPVMTFRPNKSGLYDLGGNVWEWCEEWYNGDQAERFLRGGSWNNDTKEHTASSFRGKAPPDSRYSHQGFRVVLMEHVH